MKLASRLLNALFPPQCLSCGVLVSTHATLCQTCWGQLHVITTPMCSLCSHPFEYDLGEGALCASCIHETPPYDSAYSALVYDDTSKRLLHKLKFEDQGHMAPILADWLVSNMPPRPDASMVVPVPLSRKRLFSRRYNQSALVGKVLAERLNIAFEASLLRRIKHTTPQTGLTKPQRLDNIRGAFAVADEAKEPLRGASVLLLDDVMTTGATIEACTKTLKAAGVKEVHILTIARVVHGFSYG